MTEVLGPPDVELAGELGTPDEPPSAGEDDRRDENPKQEGEQ
jgi:hypothetical protein